MNLQSYGMNYKSANVSIREKYCINDYTREQILLKFKDMSVLPFVVLSTCNRTEFYYSIETNKVVDILGYYFNYVIDSNFQKVENVHALRHLFRVACGLESQVLGENEILSQIKIAYYKSLSLGLTDKFFNILFNHVLKVARKVRKETQISSGQLSFASIVYTRIKQVLGNDMNGKRVVLIGTGEIAESTLNYFSKNMITLKIISGRNYDKALNLARIYKTEVFRFDRFDSVVNDADIIIVATSAPHFLLRKENLNNQKIRIVFDLSVPRNISPDIAGEKVILYNLDDLKKTSDQNLLLRQKAIPETEKIIEDGIKEFVEIWLNRKKSDSGQGHHFLH